MATVNVSLLAGAAMAKVKQVKEIKMILIKTCGCKNLNLAHNVLAEEIDC